MRLRSLISRRWWYCHVWWRARYAVVDFCMFVADLADPERRVVRAKEDIALEVLREIATGEEDQPRAAAYAALY